MENIKKFIKDLIEVIVISLAITFVIVNFIFMPVQVNQTSMLPNLKDKDFGFSFIISKTFGIKRFDIVVVESEDKLIVKRLIGMPNDLVEYKNNELYINGEKYDEPYLADVTTEDLNIQLKEDEYYCLGDNRNVSKDSRTVGPFSIDNIKSAHVLVLFPFKDFGFKK